MIYQLFELYVSHIVATVLLRYVLKTASSAVNQEVDRIRSLEDFFDPSERWIILHLFATSTLQIPLKNGKSFQRTMLGDIVMLTVDCIISSIIRWLIMYMGLSENRVYSQL